MKRIVFIIFWSLIVFGQMSCTANQVLPQASLPLPSATCSGSDCITVTTPDESGVVTLVADNNAVPASALVIVEIGSSSAFNLQHLSDLFIRQAQAAACVSALPECSASIRSGRCQIQADANGGFLGQITAALGTSIKINYIDSSSCAEVTRVEQKIKKEFIPLGLKAVSLAHDSLSSLFLLGSTAQGNAWLEVTPGGDNEPPHVELGNLNVTGDMWGFDWMGAGTLGQRFLMMTSEGTYYADLAFNDASMTLIGEMSPGTKLVAKKMFVQKNFTYPVQEKSSAGDNFCPLQNFAAANAGLTVNRVFFMNPDDLGQPATVNHPFSVLDKLPDQVGDDLKARPINLGPWLQAQGLDGAKITNVIDMALTPGGDRAVMLAEITQDDSARFYLIEIPLDSLFCQGNVAPGTRLFFEELPDTLVDPGDISFARFKTPSGILSALILVPDRSYGTVYVGSPLDDLAGEIPVTLLDDTHFAGLFSLLPADVTDLDFPQLLIGIGQNTNLAGMTLESPLNSFASLAGTEVDLELRAGIKPVQLSRLGTSFFILSQDNEQEFQSTLRLIKKEDLGL